MKTPEERKTEKTIIYQKYVYRGDKKTKKYKNEERKNYTIIHEKLRRGISQEYSSSY